MATADERTKARLTEETTELLQSTGLTRVEYLALSIGLATILFTNDLKRITTVHIVEIPSNWLFLANMATVLMALILLLAYRSFPKFRLSKQPPVVALIGLVLCFGVFLRVTILEGPWIIPALFIFRLGTTLFFFVWAENILPYGIKPSIVVLALALLLVGGAEMLCSFVNEALNAGLVIMAPFISMLMDSTLRHKATRPEKPQMDEVTSRVATKSCGSLITNALNVFCFTFILGGLQAIIVRMGGETLMDIVIQMSYAVGTLLAGLLLLILVQRYWKSGSVTLYRLFALPALMIALYLSTLVTGLMSAIYVVPLSMAQKLSILFFLTPLLFRNQDSWMVPICLAMAFYRAGQAFAVLPQGVWWVTALNAIAAILLILLTIQGFAAVIIERESAISLALAMNAVSASQTGSADAGDKGSDEEIDDEYVVMDARIVRSRKVFEAIANKFDLTKRESDVLTLLANKRSVPYIAETLFLSQNTVKTHVHNVYVKTGVHSKQELLELISQFEQELDA